MHRGQRRLPLVPCKATLRRVELHEVHVDLAILSADLGGTLRLVCQGPVAISQTARLTLQYTRQLVQIYLLKNARSNYSSERRRGSLHGETAVVLLCHFR